MSVRFPPYSLVSFSASFCQELCLGPRPLVPDIHSFLSLSLVILFSFKLGFIIENDAMKSIKTQDALSSHGLL
uniref:Ovule protein n=1 Tax=Caenorhabditis tropicalis TaxID=1561998 RepID=A0A1I7TZ98_9PELO